MAHIEAMVNSTGELLAYPAETPEQVVESYLLVNETIKTLEGIKAELQKRAAEVHERDPHFEHKGYGIRVSTTQRMTYDKAVLRQVLDEDTFDLMMEPAKTRIDTYLKENLEALGDASSRLRESMVPAGKAYTVVKLERLK